MGLVKTELEVNRPAEPSLPDRLLAARTAVLSLPGANVYLEDIRSKILPGEAVDTEKVEILAANLLSKEVTYHVDANYTVQLIGISAGWSEDQRKEYLSETDNQPFKAKLPLAENPRDNFETLLTVGNYLRLSRESAKAKSMLDDSEESHNSLALIEGGLTEFVNYSVNYLFAAKFAKLEDEMNGIDEDQRKSGTIQPSPEVLSLFAQVAKEQAERTSGNSDELFNRMCEATEGGHFGLAKVVLSNYRISPDVRLALEKARETRLSNPAILAKKIQLLWEADNYSNQIISYDDYAELAGLPSIKQCEANLDRFLGHYQIQRDFARHLFNETGIAAWSYQGPIDLNYINGELAKRQFLPEKPLSTKQVTGKIDDAFKLAEEYLAYGLSTPGIRNIITTAIGAVNRPIMYFYQNRDGQYRFANIIPAREKAGEFEGTLGHELTHTIHFGLILRAKTNGYPQGVELVFPPRAADAENLAMGTEQSVRAATGLKTGNAPVIVNHFGGVDDAIVALRQAPFGKTQIALREVFAGLRNKRGASQLLNDEILSVISDLVPKTRKWYDQTGINYGATANLWGNIALDATDGLNYLKRYLKDKFPDPKKPVVSNALEEIYGPDWITNSDARTIWFMQLIWSSKAGRGFNGGDIYSSVEWANSVNLEEARKVIKSFGIEKI